MLNPPFRTKGSALLIALLFLTASSLLLALLIEKIFIEKRSYASIPNAYQATLAAQSGLAAARSQLAVAIQEHPQFIVTETPQEHILLLGSTHSQHSESFTPLLSGNLRAPYEMNLIDKFQKGESLKKSHPTSTTVDLRTKNPLLDQSSRLETPWVTITNHSGIPIARYAYRFFDEQACLNPSLHQGAPRTDPEEWDQGPSLLPLSLKNNFLFSESEADSLLALANHGFLKHGFSSAFRNKNDFYNKRHFLSRCDHGLPEFIPPSLPDSGKLKYDINDIATNPIYGLTKTERATYLATIIDRNLPHFKERDPSLQGRSCAEQCRYLYRLTACIVDYINPLSAPTLINGGEPAGQVLAPLVTQVAERLRLQSRSSNSITIESQYFAQIWNPYTAAIPEGGIATFSIDNRPLLHFGAASPVSFEAYHQTSTAPKIRPNESLVLAFPTVTQTWHSPTTVSPSIFPYWLQGPEGNRNPKRHQIFTFEWNHQLIEMSRNPPVSPGLTEGGLEHSAGSLSNSNNYWHCNFIPTEQDHSHHFRFVGDPHDNYLSNYLWKSYAGGKSYLQETQWQGIMSEASAEREFNPANSWTARDFCPINPSAGNHPSSISTTPDQIPSAYRQEDALHAPLFIRHGPMNSIVELGNIHDPVQADDLGLAPEAGSSEHQTSIYACGGGRTLRIGQPESPYWNIPGKRAIELLDLFTVSPFPSKQNRHATLRKGLININTAPHEILTALFYGITPTSDARFLHSKISLEAAERLATLLESQRPYEKISDIALLITPLLANAETYTPPLSYNISSAGTPLAAVFDRAREEGLGKMISLCTTYSKTFRVLIIGQALTPHGTCNAESVMEAIITLPSTESTDNNIPTVEEIKWL